MATQVITGQSAWFGAFDLAAYARSLVLDYGSELQDDTRLSDTVRKRIGGVKNCGFSFETVNDPAFGSPLNLVMGNGATDGIANVPLSVAPAGSTAGSLAYLLYAMQASYTPINGAHGEAGKFNVAGFGNVLVRGAVIYNGVTTTTFNGAAFDYGSIPSGRTAYVAIHCTGFTGSGSIVYTLESDTDSAFTAPSTAVEITGALTGVTYRTGDGAANERYWRITGTVTGTPSATVVAVFGIL